MRAADRILVTGGLSGIGAGVVEEYGDRCVVWSRRSGVDTADEDSVREGMTKFLSDHGPPFALVHCVGAYEESPLLAADLEHYEQMLKSNLTSAFLMCRYCVKAPIQFCVPCCWGAWRR